MRISLKLCQFPRAVPDVALGHVVFFIFGVGMVCFSICWLVSTHLLHLAYWWISTCSHDIAIKRMVCARCVYVFTALSKGEPSEQNPGQRIICRGINWAKKSGSACPTSLPASSVCECTQGQTGANLLARRNFQFGVLLPLPRTELWAGGL